MSSSNSVVSFSQQKEKKTNQNIQVYVRVRPLNTREKSCRSLEMVEVLPPKEILARHGVDSKLRKKFTFDRTFGPNSRQVDVYRAVVAPLIDEVLSGYNCTVFAYGQTGTGKTHTMVGTESAELKSSWEDNSEIGIIPRALCHLFDELRMMQVEFMMRISYLELYNEELCDLLSSDDNIKIRIFDDTTKKRSVIIQGLEEIPVHSKDDVYKLLERGKERRKTASTLMNAQSSRSHTVFSIVVHIRENGLEGEELVKIGKLNLVDLAGSENSSKAGNEKGIRSRETVNINQSLLTLGRVITALVERTPHIPYRESKLTRLLQESLGGRTKTSIIATISPGHKDIEESISTLEYAYRAKNIQNKPEVNQKLNRRTVLKEYSDEIDKLKRELAASRDKNGIYLPEETYGEMTLKMESQNRELNEKVLLLKALKEELANKERMFNEISLNLVDKTEELKRADERLCETKKILNVTKRRYKEKKVLLQSHVKTEEALIKQAKQLLYIADAATNDTEKLQVAIERRKAVDSKIENTCENFHSEMCSNFKYLDDRLRDYKVLHSGHSQLLLEEFKKCSNIPQRLTNSNKQQLKIMLHESKKKNLALFEEFLKQSDNLSEECKLTLENLFESLEMKESALKKDIQSNLYDIETFKEKMKNSLERIRSSIGNLLEGSSTKTQDCEKILTTKIEHVKDVILNNIQVLESWSNQVEEEKDIQKIEQVAFTDFVQKIQYAQKRRVALTNKMSYDIKNLLDSNKILVDSLYLLSKEVKSLTTTLTNANIILMSDLNKQFETEDLNIDNNLAKNATIQTQLEDVCDQIKKELGTCRKVESTYLVNTKAFIEKCRTSHKVSLENTIQNIVNLLDDIDMVITNEAEKVKQHATICESLTIDLSTQTHEYSEQVNKQLLVCQNMLQKFKMNDLQTYLPTGQTPSKREYAYSRVLAMTSPHMKIVQRLREAKDWSDFDTTGTIDEETDMENSQIDFGGPTESISNSTPLKRNLQKCFRSIKEETSCNTPISLNVATDPHEENALSSLKSPIKGFLSYNQIEENKENVLQNNQLEE